MTNLHLLHELAGLFRDYEEESRHIAIHASIQFVDTRDPGRAAGDIPITSEIFCWNGETMQVLPEELKETLI